jgi:hypothetical protein
MKKTLTRPVKLGQSRPNGKLALPPALRLPGGLAKMGGSRGSGRPEGCFSLGIQLAGRGLIS